MCVKENVMNEGKGELVKCESIFIVGISNIFDFNVLCFHNYFDHYYKEKWKIKAAAKEEKKTFVKENTV